MDIKTMYWHRVRNLTWIFLFLWIFVAIFLPVIAPAFKGFRPLGLPTFHMYINAFIVIVLGVTLIFVYAAIMNKFDKELKSKVKEEELE